MHNSEIILHCVRLVFGGLCAFAAILLCAKKRSASVICLLTFVLTFYARSVYQILCDLGIVVSSPAQIFGVSVITLAFEVVPLLFLLLALIIAIVKK
ncbi:MAG: hypothetical protein IK015_06580 [Treponema sp.]|nr:hypothetical protein [Treponema sp.]